MQRVVVVGGSIAGFSAADELREHGFDGELRIIGDEHVRTYQRPPLSKGVLAGTVEVERTYWPPAHADELDAEWFLGERAIGLDVDARRIVLASGDELEFDGLVIATGARPRVLPGQEPLAGIHVMRTLDDSRGLRADLDADPAARVVVVGAGFIGGEVAATCRRRGHDVTVVEPLAQPLERVLGTEIGHAVADLHRREGADLRLGVGVEAVEGDDRVERVRLADGSVLAADVVVVGIGVVPNTEWLVGSGLPLDGGVVCDATTLVAPGIVAAGDVATWDSPRYGRLRIEHWDNAVDMGRAAGRRLVAAAGEAEVYDPVPWFWSDQYDIRIQMAGRPAPPEQGGELAVVGGELGDDRFVVLYGRDGEVTGALGWNWPAKAVRYRMALERGLGWDAAVALGNA